MGADRSTPGNTWYHVGLKATLMPTYDLVAQPSHLFLAAAVAVALQGAKPSALKRLPPLRTLAQFDHCSSAAHTAESNSAVRGITPVVFTSACHVSPRGPLVSPSAGRPGAMPSTW